MASHKKVSLVIVVVCGIACGSLSAQPPSDSVKQAPDSTRAQADSAKSEFPSSYDSKILQEIPKLSVEKFAFPVVTVVRPDSANHPKGFDHAAIVWMQIRVGQDHLTHEAKVVYCSAPGFGFEQAAFDESNRRQFATFSSDHTVGWFWYQVLFTGTCGSTCSDTLDLPKPDEFIPCEKQPEMIYCASPFYPAAARRQVQTGLVWIKELVDRNGFVISAMVGKTSGVELLDQSAVAAAYANRFKPAILHGQPVAVWVAYKVEYRMSN